MQKTIHKLLEKAIQAEQSDKGTLQRYDERRDELHVIASSGFSGDFLEHFKIVKPFDSSCCGRAFGVGTPISINDVEDDLSFRANLAIARGAGFRAVKSVPIINEKGEKLGVISLHYRQPKWHWQNTCPHLIAEIAALLSAQSIPALY